MSFSREGFTIDVVARFLRRTILNPIFSVSSTVAWISIISKSSLTEAFQTRPFEWPAIAISWPLLSVSVWATNYLNERYANNWVDDATWDWDKEVVVVTGGSGGIGASVVQHLIANNAKTTIVILDYSPLSWKPPSGFKIHYYQCDLSQSSTIKDVSDRIRREVGDPTVLVNNAGLSRGYTVMEGSYADVEITIRTNLVAPFLLIKEFLPHMVKRNHGHIMNISSMSSIIPPAGIADYAATKAGLNALHEALQLELNDIHQAPKIRLSVAIFSFIRTPLFKGETGLSNFLHPVLHVDTVGETLASILLSGRGKTLYMPGISRYLHSLRVLPEWMIRSVRNTSRSLRVDWRGRQKLDPKTGGLLE
ncbi:short-chain dehydrogenase [Xylaria arbuscula]|nr:short-chain dehydrogenase [Xylaria arbuscula]